MTTIALGATAKFVTDLVLKILALIKVSPPGWVIHLIVAAVTTGGSFAYAKFSGLPFDVAETFKATLGAIGLNEVVDSHAPNTDATIKTNA